jgi:histone deacetylase 11
MALKHGWAINLGGGFHHCSANNAEGFTNWISFKNKSSFFLYIIYLIGFCLFADITLTIRYLWKEVNNRLRILIVDCDAHQGNGYARDVLRMNTSEQSVL